jgi:hypothetical protein
MPLTVYKIRVINGGKTAAHEALYWQQDSGLENPQRYSMLLCARHTSTMPAQSVSTTSAIERCTTGQ